MRNMIVRNGTCVQRDLCAAEREESSSSERPELTASAPVDGREDDRCDRNGSSKNQDERGDRFPHERLDANPGTLVALWAFTEPPAVTGGSVMGRSLAPS